VAGSVANLDPDGRMPAIPPGFGAALLALGALSAVYGVGTAMAQRLLDTGCQLQVFNRTTSRAGARRSASRAGSSAETNTCSQSQSSAT